MGNSSNEVVYLRGGGKYFLRASKNITPTIRTSSYTIYSQTVAPTTSIVNNVYQSTAGTSSYENLIADNGLAIGKTSASQPLDVNGRSILRSRVDLHQSGAGGGQNLFNGLEAPTNANGRGQFVLSSAYSDLVIASSQSNNNHGSTLTFATYNPSNASEYRKFVINQGNWGTRKQFLDFGYEDASVTNPHNSINSTDTVLTLDGINKRVGIGTITPSQPLEVSGNIRTSSSLLAGANLYLNDDNTAVDTSIYFGDAASDTAHRLFFDDSAQEFNFSNSLSISGNVRPTGWVWASGNFHTNGNLYLNYDNTAADSYVYFGDAASDTAHYLRFTNASQQFTFSNRVVGTAGRLSAVEYNGSDVDKVNFALSGSTLTITTS